MARRAGTDKALWLEKAATQNGGRGEDVTFLKLWNLPSLVTFSSSSSTLIDATIHRPSPGAQRGLFFIVPLNVVKNWSHHVGQLRPPRVRRVRDPSLPPSRIERWQPTALY